MSDSNVTLLDLEDFDPTTIHWGKHTKAKEISETFNDFLGFKLLDEAWKGLFINVPAGVTFDISKAVVPLCSIHVPVCSTVDNLHSLTTTWILEEGVDQPVHW